MDQQDNGSLQCSWFGENAGAQRVASESLLGAVDFGPVLPAILGPLAAAPRVTVPMPRIDQAGSWTRGFERWRGSGEIMYGQRSFLRYAQNLHVLFGAMTLDESDFADGASSKTPLQQASEAAYRALFVLQDAQGFPHLLRTWNYFACINASSHGLERYRQFNVGRQDACLGSERPISGNLPAASALGFAAGPLTIYFLAGRGRAPVTLENPRQVSAWNYPAGYGPRSPTFSRACIAWPDGRPVLFISGTASIVGHVSVHVGDVRAQARETLANLAELVAQADRAAPGAGFSMQGLCCKVYVRDARDAPAVRGELLRRLGTAAQLVFLQADICRADLAVEIEAIGGNPADFVVD